MKRKHDGKGDKVDKEITENKKRKVLTEVVSSTNFENEEDEYTETRNGEQNEDRDDETLILEKLCSIEIDDGGDDEKRGKNDPELNQRVERPAPLLVPIDELIPNEANIHRIDRIGSHSHIRGTSENIETETTATKNTRRRGRGDGRRRGRRGRWERGRRDERGRGKRGRRGRGRRGERGAKRNRKRGKRGRGRSSPTHFFSFPLGCQPELEMFQKRLISEFPEDLDKSMCISSFKLHFTFFVMECRGEKALERVEKLKELLENEIFTKLKEIFENGPIVVEFDKLSTFEKFKNLKDIRVLYLSVKEGDMKKKLNEFAKYLADLLFKHELIQEREKERFFLHSTVFNSKYARKIRSFNAENVLEKYGESLGDATEFLGKRIELKVMELSKMQSDKNTKYYTREHSISLDFEK